MRPKPFGEVFSSDGGEQRRGGGLGFLRYLASRWHGRGWGLGDSLRSRGFIGLASGWWELGGSRRWRHVAFRRPRRRSGGRTGIPGLKKNVALGMGFGGSGLLASGLRERERKMDYEEFDPRTKISNEIV